MASQTFDAGNCRYRPMPELPAPWGPPPEERSGPDFSRLPPEMAEELRRARGE